MSEQKLQITKREDLVVRRVESPSTPLPRLDRNIEREKKPDEGEFGPRGQRPYGKATVVYNGDGTAEVTVRLNNVPPDAKVIIAEKRSGYADTPLLPAEEGRSGGVYKFSVRTNHSFAVQLLTPGRVDESKEFAKP